MPAYPWLAERAASETGNIEAKMTALRRLGHPYTDEEIANAESDLEGVMEIDALIAYLQMLGTGYSDESDEEESGE
jgi:cytochrome c oxidase cbb3-type subunit 2